jgi:Putative bacterial sensory transduction regulator
MATTLEHVKMLLDNLGHTYYSNDGLDRLMMPFDHDNKVVVFFLVLEHGGSFLQLRSVGLNVVPDDFPNTKALMEEMLQLNYENKFVKLSRDATDGEVFGYGDLWLEDSELTEQQLNRMLRNFVSCMAESLGRLALVAATGKSTRERVFGDFLQKCIDENSKDEGDKSSDPDLSLI